MNNQLTKRTRWMIKEGTAVGCNLVFLGLTLKESATKWAEQTTLLSYTGMLLCAS